MFANNPPPPQKKRYEARRSTDARGAEADAKLRASQKDCAAREALVQRLMGEVERAQDLAKSVEQTAADMKTKFEQGEDELASLREKLNLSENRISHLEGEAAKQSDVVVKQEAKLNVAKGASVRRASLSEGLMGVLMKVQTSVEHSQKFTKDCAARENAHQSTHLNAIEATDNVVLRCCLSASLRRGILLNGFVSYSLTCAQFDVYVCNRLSIRNTQQAKGYFASRAKELLLETTNAFEALVDVASELDKGKSRTAVMEKLEEARGGGKVRFRKAGQSDNSVTPFRESA